MKAVSRRVAPIILMIAAAASCQPSIPRHVAANPPIIQPGAPGMAGRVIASDKAVDLSGIQYSSADVQFMQGMIHHHAQALDMTGLVGTRTASDDMRKMALRIEVSQADELKMR